MWVSAVGEKLFYSFHPCSWNVGKLLMITGDVHLILQHFEYRATICCTLIRHAISCECASQAVY